MNSKKFILILSCLTVAFCVLIVVYNFASMPPYGVEAASAVALYNSSSQQAENIQEYSSDTVNQAPETDNTEEVASASSFAGTASKSSSKKKSTTKAAAKASTAAANITVDTATVTKSQSKTAKTAPQSPVNINTASLEQLESIPYIGPTKAQAILDYRSQNGSFTSVDGLDNVKGIGAKTIDKIRSYITV